MSYSVTHDLSREDATKLAQSVASHFEARWIKPAILILGVFIGIATIVVVMESFHRVSGQYPSSFLALLVLIIPMAVFYISQYLASWLDKRFNGLGGELPDRWPGNWTIDLSENGIALSNDWGKSWHSWESVAAAYAFPESYMLIMAGGPLYLPRPAFDVANDVQTFAEDIKRWLPDDAVNKVG